MSSCNLYYSKRIKKLERYGADFTHDEPAIRSLAMAF
jgi:hypothetical protein